MDLKAASSHLQSLSLSSSETLTSLEGLGLEKIKSVSLSFLMELTSLKGLGDSNQFITIEHCESLSDVST
ncbi:hypothetical protein ACXWQ2_09355, partial [Streptococcus pyogenes]